MGKLLRQKATTFPMISIYSFLRLHKQSNQKYYTIIKTLHSRTKTSAQICTTISTMSAQTFCKTIHSDLQNTKHTCMHYTQKYIKMSLPCNSKALTVKLPHLCANWLNTAVRCANTRWLNCRV